MCILRHTHYYICVYKAIHIAIFPPFTEKLELYRRGIPEEEKQKRGWQCCYARYIHILLYTLSCRLGIMPGYMFHLCILSYTSFVFIVYIILYEFQRGYTEEQMGFLGTAGLVRVYCIY